MVGAGHVLAQMEQCIKLVIMMMLVEVLHALVGRQGRVTDTMALGLGAKCNAIRPSQVYESRLMARRHRS